MTDWHELPFSSVLLSLLRTLISTKEILYKTIEHYDIQALLADLTWFSISSVKREANTALHSLAAILDTLMMIFVDDYFWQKNSMAEKPQ